MRICWRSEKGIPDEKARQNLYDEPRQGKANGGGVSHHPEVKVQDDIGQHEGHLEEINYKVNQDQPLITLKYYVKKIICVMTLTKSCEVGHT